MSFIDTDEFKELRDELSEFIEHCENIDANMNTHIEKLIERGHAKKDVMAILSGLFEEEN